MKHFAKRNGSLVSLLAGAALFCTPVLSQTISNFTANPIFGFDPNSSQFVDINSGLSYNLRNTTGSAHVEVKNNLLSVTGMQIAFDAEVCVPLTANCAKPGWHHFSAVYSPFSGAVSASGATLGIRGSLVNLCGSVKMDNGPGRAFNFQPPCDGGVDYSGPPPLNAPTDYDAYFSAPMPSLGTDIFVELSGLQFQPSIITQSLGDPTPGNATLWFNSNGQFKNVSDGTLVSLRDGLVSINGAGYTVPDADILFSSLAPCSITGYDPGLNKWNTVAPAQGDTEVFLAGLIAQPLNGVSIPKGATVVWSATVFASQPVSFSWKWAAAAYSPFATDYNLVGVKPGQNTSCFYKNGDQAGTPENYLAAVAGGTGSGGSLRTGGFSSAQSAVIISYAVE